MSSLGGSQASLQVLELAYGRVARLGAREWLFPFVLNAVQRCLETMSERSAEIVRTGSELRYRRMHPTIERQGSDGIVSRADRQNLRPYFIGREIPMQMLLLPEDERLLAAVGRVAILNSLLDRILRMTVKSIEGITIEQALDATRGQGASELRKTIRKLAQKKLGMCSELMRLRAILGRAERATDHRNELIHRVWSQRLDGDAGLLDDRGHLMPIPTVGELDARAAELQAVAKELNDARLEGFLKEALDRILPRRVG